MYANLDNALIGQKDKLLTTINYTSDVDELVGAAKLLNLVAPLWEACEYGYKVRELRQAVRVKAGDMLEAEHEYLAGCRKNCKTRNGTLRTIAKLEGLLQ
jgi:hypothetical protein